MSIRRFIDSDDLNMCKNFDFFKAIQKLFEIIILPEFADLYAMRPFVDIEEINDVANNNLLFSCTIECDRLNIEPDKELNSSNFIEKYIKIKDNAKNNIITNMTPVINEDYLEKASLSSEQFIIKLVDIQIKPNVYVFVDPEYHLGPKNKKYGTFKEKIDITMIINIEDISELEPGKIQALQIKYNNLCSSYTVHSVDELIDWAEQLGLYNYNTKKELCLAIKNYYGF